MKKVVAGLGVAFLIFLLGGVTLAQTVFRDISPRAWYAEAVAQMQQMGVISGYPDGTFRPDRPVTRAEVAAMLANFHAALQQERVRMESEEERVINVVANALPSVVAVLSGDQLGTGFFVDNTHILTAAHVVGNRRVVTVQTFTGRQYPGRVVKVSAFLDLALVETKPTEAVKPVRLASSYRLGQTVIAVGHPKGLMYTVTRGIISHTARQIPGFSQRYLQFDTPVNPGNSGGPLLNLQGQVVGLVVFKGSEVGIEGLGFAVRVEEIQRFLNR